MACSNRNKNRNQGVWNTNNAYISGRSYVPDFPNHIDDEEYKGGDPYQNRLTLEAEKDIGQPYSL